MTKHWSECGCKAIKTKSLICKLGCHQGGPPISQEVYKTLLKCICEIENAAKACHGCTYSHDMGEMCQITHFQVNSCGSCSQKCAESCIQLFYILMKHFDLGPVMEQVQHGAKAKQQRKQQRPVVQWTDGHTFLMGGGVKPKCASRLAKACTERSASVQRLQGGGGGGGGGAKQFFECLADCLVHLGKMYKCCVGCMEECDQFLKQQA